MQGKTLPEEQDAPSVYVGIDVCKDRLDVHIHPHGAQLSVANERTGLRRLKKALAGYRVALVTMEATGKYHRTAQRTLHQAGYAVAVVNPLRARLFAEAVGKHAKNDRIDARMLARFGKVLGPEATTPAPEILEALQELVRARHAAIDERTAVDNRLKASQTGFLGGELKRRLSTLERHIARLDAEIVRRIAADPALARHREILLSIPGIGPVVAACLIAEMPELGQLDRRSVASLAGLAPFDHDSGPGGRQRHIRGGRIRARHGLYWAAIAAARHDPQLSAFYKHLINNGKAPKVALTAVMRKLSVLANTLLSENRCWEPRTD